jgi:hypothetical protein
LCSLASGRFNPVSTVDRARSLVPRDLRAFSTFDTGAAFGSLTGEPGGVVDESGALRQANEGGP